MRTVRASAQIRGDRGLIPSPSSARVRRRIRSNRVPPFPSLRSPQGMPYFKLTAAQIKSESVHADGLDKLEASWIPNRHRAPRGAVSYPVSLLHPSPSFSISKWIHGAIVAPRTLALRCRLGLARYPLGGGKRVVRMHARKARRAQTTLSELGRSGG